MKKPTLLITRPEPQGRSLCESLIAAGYPIIYLPTLAFMPPLDRCAWERILQTISEQDWLIFVSPQAVYAGASAIHAYWQASPKKPNIAAVGDGTRQALIEAGFPVALCPDLAWGSEGLLAMPPLQAIAGQHFLIIRGEGGRENWVPALTARGAIVQEGLAYRRIMPTIDPRPYQHDLEQGKIDVLICTSFEGVRNLKEILGSPAWPLLHQIPLIVVSERIKILAADLGFQTIWVAENASTQALMMTLKQHWIEGAP